MTEKTTENLLESIVSKKPAEFKTIFEDLMVEKLREKIDDRAVHVAESLFDQEDLEESSHKKKKKKESCEDDHDEKEKD